jgi:hypothetical protein
MLDEILMHVEQNYDGHRSKLQRKKTEQNGMEQMATDDNG